jgi:branched-chain amino acid transport system substrate-binding protein
MYLLQVKSPKESKNRNDIATVARVLPAAEGSLPLADSKCYLVTGKKPS